VTVLCGGGTSSIKPGVESNLVYSSGAAAIFSMYPPLRWLQAAGAVLGTLAYDLTTICPNDPPDPPTFTEAEYTAFAISDIASADYVSFVSKLSQLAQRALWLLFCQCDGGTVPSFGTFPTPPSGVSVFPVYSAEPLCWSFTTPTTLSTNARTIVSGPFQVPTGGFYQLQTIPHDAVGSNTSNRWEVWRNTTTDFSTAFFAGPSLDGGNGAGSLSGTFGVTAGSYYWLIIWDNGTHIHGNSQARMDVFCPQTSAASCCGPDASLTDLITQVKDAVTLLQRYEVPFAYVSGAAHSGLSGSGSFTVPTGLLGLRLELTAVGSEVGETLASPDFVSGAGWWSVETVDAVIDERRIRHADQTWFPRFMPTVARVGYSLAPGTVARITELETET
jgi:hypothetical protein